jgi:hypothetical protein
MYSWYERLNKASGSLNSANLNVNSMNDKVIDTKLNANRYKLRSAIYENRKQKKKLDISL